MFALKKPLLECTTSELATCGSGREIKSFSQVEYKFKISEGFVGNCFLEVSLLAGPNCCLSKLLELFGM